MSVATIDPDCDCWEGTISVDDDGEVTLSIPLAPMYLSDAEKVAKAITRLRACWNVAWEARRARGLGRYDAMPKVDAETLAVTWPSEAKRGQARHPMTLEEALKAYEAGGGVTHTFAPHAEAHKAGIARLLLAFETEKEEAYETGYAVGANNASMSIGP